MSLDQAAFAIQLPLQIFTLKRNFRVFHKNEFGVINSRLAELDL